MDVQALHKEIRTLLKQQDAILLVHNYQRPEIQEAADILGDSLALCQKAQQVEQQRIVFCGVDFMAEAAKTLNPTKNVHHPDLDSVCPMAHMVDTEGLRLLQEQKPDAVTVSYINTSTPVKALSDYCCTSANAPEVVEASGANEVIFTPDTNLGLWIKRQLPPNVDLTLWPGYCPTHQLITVEILENLKQQHPDAQVLTHPECTPDVIDYGDACYSTQGMVEHARRSRNKKFIIASERDMASRLRLSIPGKTFVPVPVAVCPNMKKVTLQKVRDTLRDLSGEIHIESDLLEQARRPLERMLQIKRSNREQTGTTPQTGTKPVLAAA